MGCRRWRGGCSAPGSRFRGGRWCRWWSGSICRTWRTVWVGRASRPLTVWISRSRPRLRAGWRVRRICCPRCSAGRRCRWTWAAMSGGSRWRRLWRCGSGMVGARGAGSRSGWRRTTSSGGNGIRDAPISQTGCSCVRGVITASTRTAGASASRPMTTSGSSHLPRWTRRAHPDQHCATHAAIRKRGWLTCDETSARRCLSHGRIRGELCPIRPRVRDQGCSTWDPARAARHASRPPSGSISRPPMVLSGAPSVASERSRAQRTREPANPRRSASVGHPRLTTTSAAQPGTHRPNATGVPSSP